MPVAATRHTPGGAKAFAEFFIKTIDWGYATTSSTYMRHYFGETCVACRSTAVAVDKAHRKGHHFIGDRFKINRLTEQKSAGEAMSGSVAVYFDVTSTEVVDKADHYVDGFPALTNYREDLYLSWMDRSWAVSRMVPRG